MGYTKDDILQFTRLLRTSTDSMWVRVRTLLNERGIDVNASVLVESFPDDVNFEFGVLITQNGKVIQYGYDYIRKGISEGEFTEWNDITSRFNETPYGESVNTGIKLRDAKEI